MTVGELKKALNDIRDDASIVIAVPGHEMRGLLSVSEGYICYTSQGQYWRKGRPTTEDPSPVPAAILLTKV